MKNALAVSEPTSSVSNRSQSGVRTGRAGTGRQGLQGSFEAPPRPKVYGPRLCCTALGPVFGKRIKTGSRLDARFVQGISDGAPGLENSLVRLEEIFIDSRPETADRLGRKITRNEHKYVPYQVVDAVRLGTDKGDIEVAGKPEALRKLLERIRQEEGTSWLGLPARPESIG